MAVVLEFRFLLEKGVEGVSMSDDHALSTDVRADVTVDVTTDVTTDVKNGLTRHFQLRA